MAFELICKQCAEVITGDSEDEFVENCQSHAAAHGHTHPLTRKHILWRLGRHGGH
jgi:hypothetical protein